MDADGWIFLTRDEALDALAFDCQQYGPQPDLWAGLARRLTGRDCRVAADQGQQVFRLGDQTIPESRMAFYLIHLLENTCLESDALAQIAALVFGTRVACGRAGDKDPDGIWVAHGMAGFQCRRCGRCCTELIHDCTAGDVRRWQSLGRRDILSRVKETVPGRYEIWADPGTGELLPSCPWLDRDLQSGQSVCRIHQIKPRTCQEYPFTPKHAAMTGCRGRFEAVGRPGCEAE